MTKKVVVPVAVPAAAIATKPQGSLTRKVTPLIPLAIPAAMALLHGTLGLGGGGVSAPPVAAPAVVQMQSAGTTSFMPALTESTLSGVRCGAGTAGSPACTAPYPMLSKGHPVDWFFVFKLNAGKFPECGGGTRTCPFGGGTPGSYKFGQQYVVASSEDETLKDGTKDCLGTSMNDPVGATFDEVYHSGFHYLVWNDQFKGAPKLPCGANCDAPWGHSKGLMAWNDAGEGMVMQVSTPSWPGAGSDQHPRAGDQNTLGCVTDDDVQSSQHFFALRLSKDDLLQVMSGLGIASVVTDPTNIQVSSRGGPAEVQAQVDALGKVSPGNTVASALLSTGVRVIAKPSHLNVPPWQMVSALLGGVPLRTATWWMTPEIPTTTDGTKPGCWSSQLGAPGPVAIATTGHWNNVEFSLKGGGGTNGNHGKIGIATGSDTPYAIFGDENQQGVLQGNCDSSQNGRGGLFFVLRSEALTAGVAKLMTGDTAGTTVPVHAKDEKVEADQ